MYLKIFCIALLSVTTDVSGSPLTRLPEGITVHKGKVTWDDAVESCKREGGVLASPINGKALNAMKSVIGAQNISFFIGTKATELPGQFISIEGIPLENMTLTVTLDMVQDLDQLEGECLAMSRDSIRSVPCKSRLPYMCYSTDVFNMSRTNCGPDEEGYKYYSSVGHCYKLHKSALLWEQGHMKCATEGGHLAIIENAEQAEILKNIGDFTQSSYIFIGVRRYFEKYGYISIHGQPVEELYDEWFNSGVARDNISYQCGALEKSGKWINTSCGYYCHFICQKEPTY